MPKYVMIAFSNPIAGREEEYNVWYNNTHLPQVCAIDGMRSAQRFCVTQALTNGVSHKYMAIYNIESDNILDVLKSVEILHGTDDMVISSALDEDGAVAAIFEPIGTRMYA